MPVRRPLADEKTDIDRIIGEDFSLTRPAYACIATAFFWLVLSCVVFQLSGAAKGAGAGLPSSAQGASIYASRCAGCHGPDGEGIPGAFPPLKGDPVVTDKDPTTHIRTVLFGLQGKTINGTIYTAAMPAHASFLSDREVAAVINHERTSWGNDAPTVTAGAVAKVRRKGRE